MSRPEAGPAKYTIPRDGIDQVEVFREPSAEGYREVRVLRRGESLAPAFLPDLLLPVDGVLG
jgi:Uma2 family endonuclease